MIKAILIISFLLKNGVEAFVDYLDSTYLAKPLPDNVKDVYDEAEFKKWQEYEKESGRFGVIEDAVSLIINTAMLIINAYALVFGILTGMNVYQQYAVFTLILVIFSTIIEIPFDYYDTFVIEEKYGMNTTTKKTFWLDQIKGVGVSFIVLFLVIALIMAIFERFGNVAIVVGTVAMLIISLLVSLIIIPLLRIYNKFTPLEDGAIKEKLLELCDKYNVQVKKIVVKDASRRTTKSNAFCTGFGNKKTISLDDNLVNKFSEEEIVAVFAHEFAHAKYRHTLKSMPFATFNTFIAFVAIGIVLNFTSLYTAFGFIDINYYWAVTLVTLITWPLTMLLNVIGNYLSRKHEYEADAFATKEGYGDALISALKRLSKEALSDINPHPVRIILDYSHPSLSQRIEAINKLKGDVEYEKAKF